VARCLSLTLKSQSNALFAWLISHQPAVFFSQNKPATSNQYSSLRTNQHQPSEPPANRTGCKPLTFVGAEEERTELKTVGKSQPIEQLPPPRYSPRELGSWHECAHAGARMRIGVSCTVALPKFQGRFDLFPDARSFAFPRRDGREQMRAH
jgi:hypothetical protein